MFGVIIICEFLGAFSKKSGF